MEPKKLTSQDNRRMARFMRNRHWLFMEKVDEFGVIWFCCWDKDQRHKPPAPNVVVDGLLGAGYLDFMCQHKDWFKRGRWSEKKYAVSVRLTPAGIEALKNWTQYDMEPVYGGLVEPGWQAIPTPLIKPQRKIKAAA